MTFNASVPAVVPRTLIRAPQLNPILAVFRDAQAGDVLQGLGPGVVDFRPLTSMSMTMTPGVDSGSWNLTSTGSPAAWQGKTGTYAGPQDCLVWIADANEASTESAALQIDYREDTAAPPAPNNFIARTGIHVKGWTRPDRGESSGILVVQTGGGGTGTFYKTHRMRPDGKPNLAYSHQLALEVATDDSSAAGSFSSGAGFAVSAANADPTLTAAMTAVQTTVPLSSYLSLPVPGDGTIYPDRSLPNWWSPQYLMLENECISYTGGGGGSGTGTPLTGVVRGVGGTTAAAHPLGTKATWITPSHALWVRLGWPVSKGICVFPGDYASFDTRPAFAIANPVQGQPADPSPRLVIRMNGAIETAGDITTTGSLAATVQMSSNQINAGGLSASGPATLAGTETLTGVITPAQLTANTDNWSPPNLNVARVIRASTSASWNLTGIVAQPAGRKISLVNAGAQNLVLVNNSTSTAANRFYTPGGTNVTIVPQGAVDLWYDGATGGWRLMNGSNT